VGGGHGEGSHGAADFLGRGAVARGVGRTPPGRALRRPRVT
jgi:hypothetical protein